MAGQLELFYKRNRPLLLIEDFACNIASSKYILIEKSSISNLSILFRV